MPQIKVYVEYYTTPQDAARAKTSGIRTGRVGTKKQVVDVTDLARKLDYAGIHKFTSLFVNYRGKPITAARYPSGSYDAAKHILHRQNNGVK